MARLSAYYQEDVYAPRPPSLGRGASEPFLYGYREPKCCSCNCCCCGTYKWSPYEEDSGLSSQSSPSLEVCSCLDSWSSGEEQQRKQLERRQEKEIRELEDMYDRCSLLDTDVRTYAPDAIADDMALRKRDRGPSKHHRQARVTSYMLCCSHFTPSVRPTWPTLPERGPDPEYDDLCYRQHYRRPVDGPQPPFGIPLRPPPPVATDYLRVRPPDVMRQPICHPRGNPDLVRDDMAFRTLRKDYVDADMYYKKKRGGR